MRQKRLKTNRIFFWVVCCLYSFAWTGHTQELNRNAADSIPVIGDTIPFIQHPDTILVARPDSLPPAVDVPGLELPDSTLHQAFLTADSVFTEPIPEMRVSTFKPNSTRAVLYSLIPGMGQLYNQKYWKLPLVYGGFMGFIYAVTWNNKMYQDYQNAYKYVYIDYERYLKDPDNFDINADANSKYWKIYTYADEERQLNDLQSQTFRDRLKRGKDYYRRYRDLSIILMAGFYFICMIDAYVDAELFDFDISPDLSMRLEPMVVPQTPFSSRAIGLSCSITF